MYSYFVARLSMCDSLYLGICVASGALSLAIAFKGFFASSIPFHTLYSFTLGRYGLLSSHQPTPFRNGSDGFFVHPSSSQLPLFAGTTDHRFHLVADILVGGASHCHFWRTDL